MTLTTLYHPRVSPKDITIRPSGPSDGAFIAELGRTAFGEYSERAERETLRMARQAPTLLAERDGERIGFAIVEISGVTAHLGAIAVVETERGCGVGALLLRAAEQLARSRACQELTLTTADSNLAALDLFGKHGFVRRTRRGRQYSRGQPTVELGKRL